MSAAIGKLGAILSGVLFNWLSSNRIGLYNTLWIFFACNVLGAIMTIIFVPESRGIDADAVDYAETQEKLQQKAMMKRDQYQNGNQYENGIQA